METEQQTFFDKDGNEVVVDVPKRKKRNNGGCLKWAVIIVGALFLLGFCGAMLGDSGDESDTEETTEEVAEQTKEAEEESNGTITSVEEVEEENIDVDAPLVTIEELPYNIEIQQPNSIGTVYGITTYTNQSEYPIGSFKLKVNLKDQNDKAYYITHDTVMPGETSPSFDGFAPETMNPEDIEMLEISYRVILDDGSEQSVDYDVKLDRYKTLHIEDPL